MIEINDQARYNGFVTFIAAALDADRARVSHVLKEAAANQDLTLAFGEKSELRDHLKDMVGEIVQAWLEGPMFREAVRKQIVESFKTSDFDENVLTAASKDLYRGGRLWENIRKKICMQIGGA